ncbi:hypothetical protein ACH5RR_008375 [Cinchona calisaya]|uniref:Uncharacterized protein n=1 Tax=Cinchona calisaya TaxID=153742 RepID=A0ABD3AH42_9GENT
MEKRDDFVLLNPPNQQIMRKADEAQNGILDEQGVENNEVEKNKVLLMRAIVENQDHSCKIKLVEDKQLRATLLEDIDESQLPEIYGGKLPLVPIQDA